MSIDTYVLCNRPLPTVPDWQASIDRSGFPLVLDRAVDPNTQTGFWPTRLGKIETGFEFSAASPSELKDAYPAISWSGSWQFGGVFHTVGRIEEAVASTIAAVALARACDGAVFDPQEGRLYEESQLDELLSLARRYMPVSSSR